MSGNNNGNYSYSWSSGGAGANGGQTFATQNAGGANFQQGGASFQQGGANFQTGGANFQQQGGANFQTAGAGYNTAPAFNQRTGVVVGANNQPQVGGAFNNNLVSHQDLYNTENGNAVQGPYWRGPALNGQAQVTTQAASNLPNYPTNSAPLDAGTLHIRPLQAQLTHNLDHFSAQDPYVEVVVGDQAQTSSTANFGGQNPQWADNLTYNLNGSEKDLILKVWDHDEHSKPDYIGGRMIPAREVFNAPSGQKWVHLLRDGQDGGYILLDWNYGAQPVSQAASAPLPAHQLSTSNIGPVTTAPVAQQPVVQQPVVQQVAPAPVPTTQVAPLRFVGTTRTPVQTQVTNVIEQPVIRQVAQQPVVQQQVVQQPVVQQQVVAAPVVQQPVVQQQVVAAPVVQQPITTTRASPVRTYAAPATRTYAAPVTRTVAAPVTRTVAAPMTRTVTAPMTRNYSSPVRTAYAAPARRTYGSPVSRTYAAPATRTYAAPVTTVAAPVTNVISSPVRSTVNYTPATTTVAAPVTTGYTTTNPGYSSYGNGNGQVVRGTTGNSQTINGVVYE